MNTYTLLFGVAAFFSSLLGGLLAIRSRNKMGALTAFASGVLIAVPLLDLLPETIAMAAPLNVSVQSVMYLTAGGFLFLFVIERYFSVHRICENGACRNVRHPKGGLLGAIELSAHSFMDGFAIGSGFHLDFHTGFILAIAVIAHAFSDGLNTIIVMLHSGNSLRSAVRMLLLDATAPILGAAATLFFRLPPQYLVLLLPFFAGGFLYLGASDLLPEAHENNPPLVSLVFTFAGFLLIAIVTSFLGI